MTADQLITMKDEALLLTGNKRPFRFRIKPYFKQRRFRRYAKMKPAELPVLGQSIQPVSSEPEDLENEQDLDPTPGTSEETPA
jgi:type IV secretory pathway TraG/TraD family ATPase VirD4